MVRKPNGGIEEPNCRQRIGQIDLSEGDGEWIAPVLLGWRDIGEYVFSVRFDLPAEPSSYDGIALGGVFSAKDSGAVKLNGHQLASCASGTGAADCANRRVSYGTNDRSFLTRGLNTLEFTVMNENPATPHGLFASFFISAVCHVENDPKKDPKPK